MLDETDMWAMISFRGLSNSSRRGFSLLELVLVLAIMTTMSAIAVPRYAVSLARYRIDAAAKRVKAELSLARKTAKITGAALTVDVSDYQAILSESPYRALIVSADFDGDEEIVFDGYGVPDSGGTVTVQVGIMQRTVVVDADTGRSTLQEP